MKFCSRFLAIAVIASASALISCAGPTPSSYKNVTLTLTHATICSGVCINNNVFTPVPACPGNDINGVPLPCPTPGLNVGPVGAIMLPVNGGSGSCINITAVVTNAPVNLTWTVFPTPNPGATPNTGTLNAASGITNFYCQPNAIPVYSGTQLAQAQALGLQQGETEVVVTNQIDPNDPTNVVTASIHFTAELNNNGQKPGSVVVGIQPTNTVTIPLSTATTPSTYQFTGYVVGINGYEGNPPTAAKAITWEVGAVSSPYIGGVQPNGTTPYGTISPSGLYTAPTTYPPFVANVPVRTATVVGFSSAFLTIASSGTTVNFQ